MARYRTIDIRIWGDAKFQRLSPIQPSAQSLFLYLLLNPNTNVIPGIYRATEGGLVDELGWELKPFKQRLGELLRDGLVKVDWKAKIVWVPNAIKYNRPANPNVVKGWKDTWDELPECEIKNLAFYSIKQFLEPLSQDFANALAYSLGNGMPNGLANRMPNQEQEQEQEQNNITSFQEVVASIAADESAETVLSMKKNKPVVNVIPNCPHNEIIAAYHEALPFCPRVRDWHKTRKQFLKSRWNENSERQNVTWWQQFFAYVAESDFLTGKVAGANGKPSFVADLEWLVKPTNFTKVLEGKYNRQIDATSIPCRPIATHPINAAINTNMEAC